MTNAACKHDHATARHEQHERMAHFQTRRQTDQRSFTLTCSACHLHASPLHLCIRASTPACISIPSSTAAASPWHSLTCMCPILCVSLVCLALSIHTQQSWVTESYHKVTHTCTHTHTHMHTHALVRPARHVHVNSCMCMCLHMLNDIQVLDMR